MAMPALWVAWPDSDRFHGSHKKILWKHKVAAAYTLATPITGLLGLLFLPLLIWWVIKATELYEFAKGLLVALLFPIHVIFHCIKILRDEECSWPDCELR